MVCDSNDSGRVHACVTMVMIVVHGVAIPIHVVLWWVTMVTRISIVCRTTLVMASGCCAASSATGRRTRWLLATISWWLCCGLVLSHGYPLPPSQPPCVSSQESC